MKFLAFLGLLVLGFICIRWAKWITDNTTRFDWPERFFGSGGTYTMWKILGVLAIVFAFIYLFKF